VSFPTSPDSDLSCASLAFALALAPVPPPAVQVATMPLTEAVTVTPKATGRGGNFNIDDPAESSEQRLRHEPLTIARVSCGLACPRITEACVPHSPGAYTPTWPGQGDSVQVYHSAKIWDHEPESHKAASSNGLGRASSKVSTGLNLATVE
jgi:hypothetical protein